jgi:ribonuclease-3
MTNAAPGELEAILGYSFQNRELLSRALTHKSRIVDVDAGTIRDNERLEFLGDAVLGFLVSEYLLLLYPEEPEGTLSKLKSKLVSEAHLFAVALAIRAGDFLILGRGEEMNGGRGKKALLADAVEALLGAIYLDGGVAPCRAFVERWVVPGLGGAGAVATPDSDYKSHLQELAQQLKLPVPRYSVVGERGPDHAKTFVVEARIGREWSAKAEGPTKKSAGQGAARAVIEKLGERAPS